MNQAKFTTKQAEFLKGRDHQLPTAYIVDYKKNCAHSTVKLVNPWMLILCEQIV